LCFKTLTVLLLLLLLLLSCSSPNSQWQAAMEASVGRAERFH
jgi:hypothetical protein